MLVLGLSEADGEPLVELEGLSEALGLRLADGDKDKLTLDDGDKEADGEADFDTLDDGDVDADGEIVI